MRGAFRETWARIVRKEIKQVHAAARRRTSDDEFKNWSEEFAEEHRDFARECLKELYAGYCELVGKDASSLEGELRQYEAEIVTASSEWAKNPSDGYKRSEDKTADYWTTRMLSYDSGRYETAT